MENRIYSLSLSLSVGPVILFFLLIVSSFDQRKILRSPTALTTVRDEVHLIQISQCVDFFFDPRYYNFIRQVLLLITNTHSS